MTRHRLRHLAPLRFGIIFGFVTGVAGLIMIPIVLFAGGLWASVGNPSLLGIPWLFFGAGAIFMPLIYAVAGFVVGVLMAMVYNFAVRWTGGIEFHTDDPN
ncbi:MAG TPA: hypothetical protein VGM73_02540 [Candidatus Didemnitutus sp.]|jgi:hypothetical protein